jgi:hypothetical protein
VSFPTIRQQKALLSSASFPAPAAMSSSLDSSAQAGNLLVVCATGDKDTGALTVTDNVGGAWTSRISQPGGQGSLYMATKVASGGESTITATVSSPTDGGNSGLVLELVDDGAGAWQVQASALASLNTADRSSVSSGTTDAAEHDALAIAAAMIDSISSLTDAGGSLTDPTFSNGFTRIHVPASAPGAGGGNAGCYVGTRTLAKGATTSTTFATNVSGGDDALSLGIVAFGRMEQTGPVEKSGSDSAIGSESGGVTSAATGTDTATGTDSGHVAQSGGDTASGTEEGYSGEERLGGDVGTGTETYDSSAAVTPGPDTAAGTETYDSSATVTPGPDTATGTELGLIAIPGEDVAAATDSHVPPTEVTVTTGEEALGADGGYVETLYGDLIVNLYAIDPDTGEAVALPDYVSLDFSRERNSKGALSLNYSIEGKGFDLLRSAVTTNRDLEIELWTNGTPTGALRGYLQEASGDDVAEEAVWSFAGSFIEVRTDEVVVYPQDRGSQIVDPDTGEATWSNAKRELIFNADSPGAVAATLLDQAHDRGAMDDITRDFTTTHDSNGTPWPGLLTAKFSPGVTYTQILNKLVDLHLAEWAIVWNGTEKVLKLWVAEGRGADLTLGPRPVTLRRGRNLLDAPRKWSVREAATTLLAAGSEGVYDEASDVTALARRGRRVERYASLGSASEEDAVLAFAQAELATLTPGLVSIEHGIGMLPGEPRPIIAYDIGDWIYSQTGTETERLRVVQYTVRIDADRQLSGTTTLNDTVRDAVERMRERLNAITSGEAVTGTSEPGGISEPDRTPPAAPEGLVASSLAYQDPEHGPGQTLAMVTVGWLPVTTNADGSDSPLVQAAVYIRDKLEDDAANPPEPDPDHPDGGPDYDPIHEDWTWKGCPTVVADFNDPLLALYEDDGSPADQVGWLTYYIAEASQTPTAAEDVAGYDVRYHYLGLGQVGGLPWAQPYPFEERVYYTATLPGGTSATEYSFGGVEGGSRIRIEVRAFDRAGNKGAWAIILHDTANDTTAPPVPSAPEGLKTWFRTLDVPWDGLGAEGEPMPVDFSHARVWVGQGADLTLPEDVPGEERLPTQFDPLATAPQYVANLYAAGTWNVPDLPIGVGYYAALQTVDRTGNVSARSVVVGPVTAQQLVGQDIVDGIIDATKLGPDSVQSLHVVDGAMTSAKIADAAIIRAKIADLAVNSAKIESIEAGKITTGTMTATVTISGSIWTSTDPNATRLGLSAAGLQLYRARSGGGSDLVGAWRTADGFMLVTGTFQSALSGRRIHIDPDGSMRFYPTSGTNYSRMMNEGNDIVWRGPLDGDGFSGRINVNSIGAALSFSREEDLFENLTSEFVLHDRRMRSTATSIIFELDERRDPPSGYGRAVQFQTLDDDGDAYPYAFLQYVPSEGSNDNRAALVGNTVGLVFMGGGGEDARLEVRHATSGWSSYLNVHATSLVPSSSQEVKEDIEDIRAAINPLEVIRQAQARKYVQLDAPTRDPRVGIIAEELPEILVNRDAAVPGIDLVQVVGTLWGAFNQVLSQQIVSASAVAVLDAAGFFPPNIFPADATAEVDVTWDSTPPAAPTGGFAQISSSFVWATRVTAWVKTGSTTATGCTVVFKNISGSAFPTNPDNENSRVVANVTGLGLYTPPYIPPEEA